ncbi:MAG: molybdenum cofactor biosynthesis protein MoaE [Solirubrobacteraceae bacterium]|nr:molybdenum cofactor biosynthesis protein MoaE [Solirubrobacteraceae bacterium]
MEARPPHVAIRDTPLDPAAITALVTDERAGAVITFSGVTREVPSLDYEVYGDMAEKTIREIAEAAQRTHGLAAVAVEHRTGTVALSEPSVVVAVSAGHRPEAFEGAREIIDELKARAPIWKREERDGEYEAVEGTLPA